MAKTLVSQSNSQEAPTHEEIAAQAYEIYLREGSVNGRDLEHWLQAEQEVLAKRNGNGHSDSHEQNGLSSSHSNGASRSYVEAPSASVMTAAASPMPSPSAGARPSSSGRKTATAAKR